jgi:hypothetical protein
MTTSEAPPSTHGSGHGQDALQKRVDDGPKSGASTWYEVLDVAPDVSPVDLKKAYDRALALVEGRSIGGYLMLDPLAAESARADVEAAFAVLGDPERRAAYDKRLARKNDDESGEAAVDSAPAKADVADAAPEKPEKPVEKANDKVEKPSEKAAGDDHEAKEARALLAIAEAQQQRDPVDLDDRPAPPPRTMTPGGLRFLAPAVDPEPSSSSARTTSSPGIKFEPPQTWPGEGERMKEDLNAPLSATSTLPPEAAMPPPATILPSPAPAPASTGLSTIPQPASQTSLPGASTALPEGEINGEVIRQIRDARGLSLDQVAEATKIRKPYLKAIEESDVPNLPDRVYLRGFLTQIGRVLKVDRNRLAEGYLQFVEKSARG